MVNQADQSSEPVIVQMRRLLWTDLRRVQQTFQDGNSSVSTMMKISFSQKIFGTMVMKIIRMNSTGPTISTMVLTNGKDIKMLKLTKITKCSLMTPFLTTRSIKEEPVLATSWLPSDPQENGLK